MSRNHRQPENGLVFDQSRDVEARKLLEAFANSQYFDLRYAARSQDEVTRRNLVSLMFSLAAARSAAAWRRRCNSCSFSLSCWITP